jgi:hypothetical protein
MGILVIDEGARAQIAKLIAYAESRILGSDSIKKTLTGDRPPAGDYEDHTITLPTGYRIVYSIEEQPVGLCSHLSVSTRFEEKLPAPEAVELIMSEFGMGASLKDCLHIWIEDDSSAVNILSKKAQP